MNLSRTMLVIYNKKTRGLTRVVEVLIQPGGRTNEEFYPLNL